METARRNNDTSHAQRYLAFIVKLVWIIHSSEFTYNNNETTKMTAQIKYTHRQDRRKKNKTIKLKEHTVQSLE